MQHARPIRIGFDVGKALEEFDGMAKYSLLLLRTLMEVDADNEYLLFDVAGRAVDETRYRELFPTPPPNFNLARERWPSPGDLDLFHSPAFALPHGNPCPLVFTLHDLTFLSHAHFHILNNRMSAVIATAKAASFATAIIAVSHHSKSQAVELLGLPEERVEVIHSAADPVFQPVEDRERLVELQRRMDVDRPYVLAVGSLEPRKNLVGLVDALLSLPEGLRGELQLVIAGPDGWLNQHIHDRLRTAAREITIRRVGRVSVNDLVALYSFAEVLVYPSFSEGFGLPVLEAMACGAPVVTSSVSSLPEVAGEAALLVDPHDVSSIADAVERVLTDASLREDMRRRGFERVGQFSWRRCASQTLDLYRRVAP
jgi:glycosyltransferase involved in cell wall biosynthesis